jgi:hypothetical protein
MLVILSEAKDLLSFVPSPDPRTRRAAFRVHYA